jgi:hypothetical protein
MKQKKARKKKAHKGILWFILICAVVLSGGYYYRREIAAKLSLNAPPPQVVSPESRVAKEASTHRAATSNPTVSGEKTIRGKFTFLPDIQNPYAWLVKYPDGRVFKLGKAFSSECNPTVGMAKDPATVRLEFNEEQSCNSSARKAVQADAAGLRDVNGDGSPEIIVAILTGGNVNGHTSSLISLTPKGPKTRRRLD